MSPWWPRALPRVWLSRVGMTGQAERLLHSQLCGLGVALLWSSACLSVDQAHSSISVFDEHVSE